MYRQYNDCPNLNMCPASTPHEHRFDIKVKRSDNLKLSEKTCKFKKTEENKS